MAEDDGDEPSTARTRNASATLSHPPTGRYRLHRPSLSRLLDEATKRPLTLVVSPPGTGKTATLAAWDDESATTSFWLSFEDVRNEHRAIVLAFLDSVASTYPAIGQRAFTVLDDTDSLEDAVRPLIDDLSSVERSDTTRVVLIIDDLHRVDHDADLLRALTLLVSYLPDWLRIVVTSRRNPALPLDRLRARGLLAEVRYADLKLSQEDSLDLLVQIAPSITDDDAITVATEADGWAAYLQMAASASRSSGSRPGNGHGPADAHALIEDYIWHEVFADEPAELVTALSMLAVAPRVNASLAAHLLEDPRGAQVLSQADHRGLFLQRGEDRWYEFHPLVREVLRADFARGLPAQHTRARLRLAHWYEQEGDSLAALDVWMTVGEPREALRLLALNHAELYDTGRESAVAEILASIPDHVVASDPQALLNLAWCHVLLDRRRFVELVERARWWCDHEPFEPAAAARLTILRSMATTMQGDHATGGELARQALAHFGPNWWGDPLGRFGWNVVAREVALDDRWDDTGEEVHHLDLELGRDPGRRLAFEGTRALGLARSGHPVDALRIVAGVRRAAEVANMTILRAELILAEALALREIGDRQRALRQLEDIASTPAETMLLCRVIASVELVHAHIDRGDRAAARSALQRAHQLIETEAFLPDGAEALAVAAVRLALADGDADLARQRAATIKDRFWGPASIARVQIAVGEADAARTSLAAAEPRGARQLLIDAILRSLAGQTDDETARWATVAVETATANGMLQTVAAEGTETIRHLEQWMWPAPEDWFERVRRAAADVAGRTPTVRIDLVEPLTDREWDVIRYLPSRLTVREIAAELYVSVNTLKSHMKAVYRKLGVSSRQEAAGVARTMLAARRRESGSQPGPGTPSR